MDLQPDAKAVPLGNSLLAAMDGDRDPIGYRGDELDEFLSDKLWLRFSQETRHMVEPEFALISHVRESMVSERGS